MEKDVNIFNRVKAEAEGKEYREFMLIVGTESKDSVDLLRHDIEQEIGCCSNNFDINSFEEVRNGNKIFTIGNADDLDAAISGISQFMHNWCMDCAKTESSNLTFRCSNCEFEEKNGYCTVKRFLNKHTSTEKAAACSCMSR